MPSAVEGVRGFRGRLPGDSERGNEGRHENEYTVPKMPP
jgi:hypothetical protein